MIKTVLPILTRRIDKLAALPWPAADHARVIAIVRSGRAAITAARNDPQMLSPASAAPFEHFNRLLTDFGISTCTVGR